MKLIIVPDKGHIKTRYQQKGLLAQTTKKIMEKTCILGMQSKFLETTFLSCRKGTALNLKRLEIFHNIAYQPGPMTIAVANVFERGKSVSKITFLSKIRLILYNYFIG